MNYNEVKELISIFVDTDLTEMELQFENLDIRLNRGEARYACMNPMPAGMPCPPPMPPVVPAPVAASDVSTPAQAAAFKGGSAVTATEPSANAMQDLDNAQTVQKTGTEDTQESAAGTAGKVITAPLVGTFYGSPAPDQPPFVKAGDTVAEGDVVCIIEAMKFMNEVNSDVSGKVAEILVKDGELVEYGQPLLRIV